MNRQTHKESLLTVPSDYQDSEGDVRHIDDNPDGFDAEGKNASNTFYERRSAAERAHADYAEIAEEDDVPGVSVNLGERAVHLSAALDAYSKISMLNGLLRSGNSRQIRKYGGEAAIRRAITKHGETGRRSLREGTGINAMLERPHLILDDEGGEYDELKAHDDLVTEQYGFKTAYTAEGVRNMSSDTSARDKRDKVKAITKAREGLKTTLERQKP